MDFPAVPIELVRLIIETAAQDYVAECRSWALQLALLSHSIARSLRPILFHSVIVDEYNESYFATAGPSDLALSFARHLSISPKVKRHLGTAILARWKPAVGSFLCAHWHVVRHFMDTPEAQSLRGVEVRYERLLSAFAGRYNPTPANIARQLTRVAGFIPLWWNLDGQYDPVILAHEWAAILCDKLPALVNLGLDLFQVDQSWTISVVVMEHHPDSPSPPEQYLNTLRDVLIALLDIKPRLRICIRVRGKFI